MTSLRRRMLLWQGIAILVAVVLAAWLGQAMAWHGFNKVRDHGLEQVAYAIVRHGLETQGADPVVPLTSLPEGHDRGQFISQIWHVQGELQYSSSPDGGPEPQADGFGDVWWHEQEWRVFSVRVDNRRVQVAVAAARREASFDELLPWMAGLALTMVALLLLLSQVGARLAFQPMQRLQKELAQRNPQSLQPMDTAGMPDEIKTLGVTFNQLLGRLDRVLQEQRQFLSDAAHGLNTPLAALKLRAQLLPLVPPQGLPQAFKDLDQAIERTVHLVAQLLRLVRITPAMQGDQVQWVDLGQLVQQVLADLAPVWQKTGHGVEWKPPVPAVGLSADAAGLRSMLENLLSNAFIYAPTGTTVRLLVGQAGEQVWLEVIDHGPGVPDAQKDRALERFARLTPGDGKGSGLGLAISQAVAQQHGGQLSLRDTPGGGLTVHVTLAVTGSGGRLPSRNHL